MTQKIKGKKIIMRIQNNLSYRNSEFLKKEDDIFYDFGHT
jgi:hypothetical protein